MYGIRDFHSSLNSFTYLIWFMLPDLRFFFFLLSPLYFKIRMLFGCFYNNRNYFEIYHLFIYWRTVSMALTVILVLKTLHWCFVNQMNINRHIIEKSNKIPSFKNNQRVINDIKTSCNSNSPSRPPSFFPLPSTYWTEKVIQCTHILNGSLSSTNYIDPTLR